MGSPSESYDSKQASRLLKSKGDDMIATAARNLLSRGILSKSQRDAKKQGPGRQLKISETYVMLIKENYYLSDDKFVEIKVLLEASFLLIFFKTLRLYWT